MADKNGRKSRVISFDIHKENCRPHGSTPLQNRSADQSVPFRKIPLADMIRTYRKKAGISQQELGDKLGVTRNTVVNWEGGKYRPDIDLLLPLCSIFGITLYELFGTQEHSLGITSHEKDLLDQYRKISPLSRRIVDRMVGSILYEESEDRNRRLIESSHLVGVLEVTAAAGDGLGFSDIPMEASRFVFVNDVNKKADAVLLIKGDSMLPMYHSGDMVYVQFTQSPDVGEDVICRSKEGFHIKRLGEKGPYSLNPEAPFTLTFPDDRVETIGRVLGVVDTAADFPGPEENGLLRELCHEEIDTFRQKYHLTKS
ncbi:MAG: LexA family transcriptional regulator [Blautia sp.]|nr:LexA family transcriptional regulator [Blautia sp.]